MNWTTDKPTQPGWYWVSDPLFQEPNIVSKLTSESIVRVFRDGRGTLLVEYPEVCEEDCGLERFMVDDLIASYWAGPIEEPEV